MKRWFTCTPVAFGGGADFFARDSGLMARGLQSLGVESRAVMPGERQAGDEPDLLRTDYRNLECADWWRELKLDGVVLYAWGRPKFRKVAAALHDAGVFLVLNQDNGGLVSPRLGWADWLEEQKVLSGAGRVPGGWRRFARLLGKGVTWGVFVSDYLRAGHLRQGDVIACVSPVAVEHHRRFCRMVGGKSSAARVELLPHPVGTEFCYQGSGKKMRQVVVAGRWDDDCQKRPGMLMAVTEELLAEDAGVEVDIIGSVTGQMSDWHAGLAHCIRERVRMHGRLSPGEIPRIMQAAQVAYCPSAYESFHIASGEALCCGCSVVAGRSPSLASFGWFVGEGSGTLARGDDIAGHVSALREELGYWESGKRDADAIAAIWSDRLHADRVAARVIGFSSV